MDRRHFLRSAVAAGTFAAAARVRPAPAAARSGSGPGPYGPLGEPDANGIRLPAGFRSRVVARSGTAVPGSSYAWHAAPDGGAVFATPGGGWVYVSNSEVSGGGGGAGAVRFDARAEVVDAYRVLDGTSRNCSGGATPWGTWLSCEEHDGGRVWECDPLGALEPTVRPALGVFSHEAVAVDPEGGRLYLTEDESDGCFYRFTPEAFPDLGAGLLEVAVVGSGRMVSWVPVPDPSARSQPTRRQVVDATNFRRGEGAGFHDGVVYFTTTADGRVWAYGTATRRLDLIYDARAVDDPPLTGVDNVAVSPAGDVLVAEDGGNMELVAITPEGDVGPVLRMEGEQHRGSEVTGPAFDPSGTRLYVSSQRGFGSGVTYEISGPFRRPPATEASAPRGSQPPATEASAAPGGSQPPATEASAAPGGSPRPAARSQGTTDAGGSSGDDVLVPVGLAGFGAAAAALGALLHLRRRGDRPGAG